MEAISHLNDITPFIEDNVQFVLARKQKCRVIITNNYKDYRLLLGAQIIKPSKVRTIARWLGKGVPKTGRVCHV